MQTKLRQVSKPEGMLGQIYLYILFNRRQNNYDYFRRRDDSQYLTELQHFDTCFREGFHGNGSAFWFYSCAPSLQWIKGAESHDFSTTRHVSQTQETYYLLID